MIHVARASLFFFLQLLFQMCVSCQCVRTIHVLISFFIHGGNSVREEIAQRQERRCDMLQSYMFLLNRTS
uniref:Secreted protein n=1 Tax=Arundo donax TaxID=35708 RepID=A0A0A9EC02_ARUDO